MSKLTEAREQNAAQGLCSHMVSKLWRGFRVGSHPCPRKVVEGSKYCWQHRDAHVHRHEFKDGVFVPIED